MNDTNKIFIEIDKITTALVGFMVFYFFITIGIGMFKFYSLPKDMREEKIKKIQPILKAYKQAQWTVLGLSHLKDESK